MSLEFTPKKTVTELDKYIIGQKDAKKSVAVALRNRTRRQKLPPEMQEEITPKNILMIGPTGVGKTEIARRLAKLVKAPFLKVEASKFTEVGYVGRDVESMIREIAQAGVNMVREDHMAMVRKKAEELAEERLLDLLVPPVKKESRGLIVTEEEAEIKKEEANRFNETREKIRAELRAGRMEEKYVEINVQKKQVSPIEILSGQGMEEIGMNIQEMMENLQGAGKSKRRKVNVREARDIIIGEETAKLIDMEKVTKEAIEKVENSGIIFIDEIDKIASAGKTGGIDVSREGVQRDILPIVEGTTVMTKYGPVRTDHILFIAAGAFHVSKPSDLIPELQGRFPIRVELNSLTMEDFVKILTEPQNSLIRQYTELMKADSVNLKFGEDAVNEMAKMAFTVNETNENIGARRLHTIMEKVLEDISFEAPYDAGETDRVIDAAYVKEKLTGLVKDKDLTKYIL